MILYLKLPNCLKKNPSLFFLKIGNLSFSFIQLSAVLSFLFIWLCQTSCLSSGLPCRNQTSRGCSMAISL